MRRFRNMVVVTAVMVAGVMAATGCGEDKASSKGNKEAATEVVVTDTDDVNDSNLLTGMHHVKINIKDYGTIEVELDADTAPITDTNFEDLANEGFYDGLTFHRIIDGFMIQGGDPLGNGTGGSEKEIKGEFSDNGVENKISHTRGTISMARAQDNDSASSQFFIMQADGTYLDGAYAGFGHVTSGMDIVDKICKDVEVQDGNGTVLAEDQPVIEKIEVVD